MIWPFARRDPPRDAKAIALARRIEDVRAEQESLPERRWIGRDRAAAERDLAALQREMIALLEAGPLAAARDRLRGAEAALREARAAEARLREDVGAAAAATAPEVQRAGQATREAEAALTRAHQGLRAAFEAARVPLTEAQLEALAMLPGGDDDIGLISCVVSLREVMAALAVLLPDRSDPDSAARYYGYAVLFLETLLVVQERVVARIREEHVPAIQARLAETRTLQRETARLRAAERDGARRALLEANAAAQGVALEAIAIAQERFRQKLQRLAVAVARTRADLAVARNTHQTVRVTQDLARTLRRTDQLFDELTRLSVPEVIPFAGEEIRAELLRLANRVVPRDTQAAG
ncbi:hypothetical protein [Paracraurococcus lichenis]|uniref:Uncharacterized protein n=1 Tax=Paracraurococcus lichenis TaxID=3064888 RepID=A0ABT9DXU8_9PROT|nr:hypothetical protein [Paracraurococcus sp. LOR1-02]MDO9708729.1 hypothetical protein [Paracraurococcus sp. LOR1-02]